MPAFIDLTGQKFGLLTVVKRAENVKGVQWVCKCDCGNTTIVRSYALKSGATKSCGCLRHIQYRKSPKLVGKRFGRLKVIRRNGSSKHKRALWLCRCDCGNEITVIGNSLTVGRVNSCGCLRKELAADKMTSHGFTTKDNFHPLYELWKGIKDRTSNPNNVGWHNYGGRGIKICDRWKDSFPNFLEDMGERPSKKHSIDRIDNDGDYCPTNCRWATKKEQSYNTRRNKTIIIDGIEKTIPQWCKIYGMSQVTFYKRVRSGMSHEEAITTPLEERYRKYGFPRKKNVRIDKQSS